jgi:tetratricopeptide (TPR) repeat protein
VVLDGVTSPGDLDGLWPEGPGGQVVVTSRLRAEALGGHGPGRTACGVPGFSRREALGYLNSRLTAFPDQRIEALDLAEDIGGLPIAMAQAAAVVTLTESTCRNYRIEYAERLRTTAGTLVDGCPQSMLATWSLAVEHAHEQSPTGPAWAALAFASVLDTGGIPAAVLTSPAACGYITGGGGDQNLVRAAYANLERLGLLSVDSTSAVRTVWLHSAVRAAVRAYLAPGSVEQVVQAAANALVEAWPPGGADGDGGDGAGNELSQALRDCTGALRAFAGDMLWKPDAHPVLLRAGASLADRPPLADAAIGYWQAMTAICTNLLGRGHAQSVYTRDRLADAYATAGRLTEALAAFEAALSDRERTLGPQHPDTVAARLNTARSLEAAGREPEAIALYEQALTARMRLLGPAHRDTVAVRSQLAAAYSAAGRHGDGIRLYERTLADAERELGQAHPAAVAARAGLANAYRLGGRIKEAIGEYERVLADRERLAGPDHPDTITARGNLGYAYRTAGRFKDAIPQYERTLAGRERISGPDGLDTITARAILAAAYQLARRLREAIDTYERALADSERVLGAGDIETLTTRCNLATAYFEAGRLADGVTVLRRALADCSQYLGAGHPMTDTVRENLRAATG